VSNADQVVSVRADQIRVSIDEVVTPDEPVEEEDASLAHVLDDVEGFMRRFLAALSDAHFTVLALFTAHTYAIGAADTTVYIHTTSAEVECGKTRLLEVLELLTHRPAMLLDPSAAALYRGIDSGEMVTLLIDEVDTYLPGGKADSDAKKTIVGLLNGGYRRGGKVARVRDRTGELDWFEVFGPKVLTGLAPLPMTLASRSLRFVMRRRREGETIDRLRFRTAREDAAPIVEALTHCMSLAAIDTLRAMRPELPDELSDRLQDACEPLVAIADLAGGRWPKRIRDALLSLVGEARAAEATESRGTELLADIRDAFVALGENIGTAVLLDRLNGIEERGWGGWNDGQGLRPRNLGKLLRPFEISSKDIHAIDGNGRRTLRGYEQTQFEDAFARYLPRQAEAVGLPMAAPPAAPSTPSGTSTHAASTPEPRQEARVAHIGHRDYQGQETDGVVGVLANSASMSTRMEPRSDGVPGDNVEVTRSADEDDHAETVWCPTCRSPKSYFVRLGVLYLACGHPPGRRRDRAEHHHGNARNLAP